MYFLEIYTKYRASTKNGVNYDIIGYKFTSNKKAIILKNALRFVYQQTRCKIYYKNNKISIDCFGYINKFYIEDCLKDRFINDLKANNWIVEESNDKR